MYNIIILGFFLMVLNSLLIKFEGYYLKRDNKFVDIYR